MVHVLQLDPDSLALWINQTVLGDTEGPVRFGPLVEAAYRHDLETLQQIDGLGHEHNRTRQRAIVRASEVWHEQRHFLDLVLTNYGQYRWRRGYQMINNMPAVAQELRESVQTRLAVPLSVYDQPISARKMGCTPTGRLRTLARAQKTAAEFARADATEDTEGFAIGGEAQLEALAYTFQTHAAALIFGTAASRDAFRRFIGKPEVLRRYGWLHEIAFRVGLGAQERQAEDVVAFDQPLLMALLYAALNGRYHGLSGEDEMDAQALLPSLRLVQILPAAKARLHDRADPHDGAEALDFADRLCRDLFGRSILEEMEADWAAFEKKREAMLTETAGWRYAAGLQALRKDLIALLKSDPAQVFEPGAWMGRLAPRLAPMPISCNTEGWLGELPEGYKRVLEYDMTSEVTSRAARRLGDDLRWVWAAVPADLKPCGDNPIRLPDFDDWIEYASEMVPMIRVLTSGWQQPPMLGAELVRGKVMLERALEVEVVFAEGYEKPREIVSSFGYASATGKTSVPCDFSGRQIRLDPLSDECSAFSKWDLFELPESYSDAISEHLAAIALRLGASRNVASFIAARQLRQSWSPWFVDKRFSWEANHQLPFPELGPPPGYVGHGRNRVNSGSNQETTEDPAVLDPKDPFRLNIDEFRRRLAEARVIHPAFSAPPPRRGLLARLIGRR